MKAFADDKLKVIQMQKFVPDKTENIEGKEENAGYQHFLLFSQCFKKAYSLGSLKPGLCGKGITLYYRTKSYTFPN